MAKIFETNFQTGSLKDTVSGDLLTNNGAVFKKTEKGMTLFFDGNAKLTKTSDVLDFSNDTFELIFAYKKIGTDSNGILLGSDSSSTEFIVAFIAQFRISTTGGAFIFANINASVGKYVFVTISTSGGSTTVRDLTNNASQTLSVTGTLSFDNIGQRNSSTTSFLGDIQRVIKFDDLLSAQERSKLYEDFLASQTLGSTIRNYVYSKPDDLSQEDGLVFASNMVPSAGGVLTDISGNGYDGVIDSGVISVKEGMKNSVLTTGIELSDAGDLNATDTSDFTWAFQYKDNAGTINKRVFSNSVGANGYEIYSSSSNRLTFRVYTAGGNEEHNLYTNLSQGFIHDVVISKVSNSYTTYINGVNVGTTNFTNPILATTENLHIFKNSVSSAFSLLGEIYDISLYNTSKDSKFAKDYHNKFANEVYISEDFRYAKADGTDITPDGWNVGTGLFKAIENAGLDGKSKALECTSAGIIALQSKQAYGTWEFDLSKNATQPVFSIISSDVSGGAGTGYQTFFLANGDFRFNLSGASILFSTGANYLTNLNTYRVKITRTLDGEFTTYIKGGTFGNAYVLVDVSGGSGLNPVTENTYKTSNYIVLDLDTGDQFTNILLKKGVAQ